MIIKIKATMSKCLIKPFYFQGVATQISNEIFQGILILTQYLKS